MLNLNKMYVSEYLLFSLYAKKLEVGADAYVYDAQLDITFKGNVVGIKHFAKHEYGMIDEFLSSDEFDYAGEFDEDDMASIAVGIKVKPCLWRGKPETTNISHS